MQFQQVDQSKENALFTQQFSQSNDASKIQEISVFRPPYLVKKFEKKSVGELVQEINSQKKRMESLKEKQSEFKSQLRRKERELNELRRERAAFIRQKSRFQD